MCATRSSADCCWLLHKTRGVCCCCISVWAGLTDAVHMLVKYSCTSGSPTVERELSFHCVHSPGVLGHTLVRAGILLLEIWDFQDAAGFPHVHFPGKGHTIHSPPVYGWYRAVRRDNNKCTCSFQFLRMTYCSSADSYLLKHYLRVETNCYISIFVYYILIIVLKTNTDILIPLTIDKATTWWKIPNLLLADKCLRKKLKKCLSSSITCIHSNVKSFGIDMWRCQIRDSLKRYLIGTSHMVIPGLKS